MDLFRKLKLSKQHANAEKGMTMLELLVVISIVSILLLLGVNSFVAMRRIQQLEQTSRGLYDLLRGSQRGALLYDRTLGENWVWGTVLSFEDLNDGTSVVRSYKYCAPQIFTEFQAYPDTTELLPIDSIAPGKVCNTINASLALQTENELGDDVQYFTSLNKNANEIQYVVFETISGKIHYYASDGTTIDDGSALELVMGNNAPSRVRIFFAGDKSKFYMSKVSGTYETE